MPELLAKITDKKLQSITKTIACGVVPGLIVKVSKLQNGYLRKYFFLRYQRNGSARHFALGAYPEMSSAEALKKAAEWRKKNRRRHRPFRRAKNQTHGCPASKPDGRGIGFQMD